MVGRWSERLVLVGMINWLLVCAAIEGETSLTYREVHKGRKGCCRR
jgi:hypothetical protein